MLHASERRTPRIASFVLPVPSFYIPRLWNAALSLEIVRAPKWLAVCSDPSDLVNVYALPSCRKYLFFREIEIDHDGTSLAWRRGQPERSPRSLTCMTCVRLLSSSVRYSTTSLPSFIIQMNAYGTPWSTSLVRMLVISSACLT